MASILSNPDDSDLFSLMSSSRSSIWADALRLVSHWNLWIRKSVQFWMHSPDGSSRKISSRTTQVLGLSAWRMAVWGSQPSDKRCIGSQRADDSSSSFLSSYPLLLLPPMLSLGLISRHSIWIESRIDRDHFNYPLESCIPSFETTPGSFIENDII